MKLLVFFSLALTTCAQSPSDSIKKQKASIAIQREAVRKQASISTQYRVQPDPSQCDPLPDAELAPIIDAAAQAHQIETKLLRAVIDHESGARPCAVSPSGASGLMQLMPAALEEFQVADPFDPKENVEAGASLLKLLMDKYKGSVPLVLAAFNAGAAAVDQAGGTVPDIKETKDYVETILARLR